MRRLRERKRTLAVEVAGVARRLRKQHLLLVVDNFEHVLGAAPLVTRLLEASEHLEVLATSREPLRLRGEHEYGVPPLEAAPALFIERVGAIRPDISWNEENVRAAHEICRRVDHLPLAVELVAGGARIFAERPRRASRVVARRAVDRTPRRAGAPTDGPRRDRLELLAAERTRA